MPFLFIFVIVREIIFHVILLLYYQNCKKKKLNKKIEEEVLRITSAADLPQSHTRIYIYNIKYKTCFTLLQEYTIDKPF